MAKLWTYFVKYFILLDKFHCSKWPNFNKQYSHLVTLAPCESWSQCDRQLFRDSFWSRKLCVNVFLTTSSRTRFREITSRFPSETSFNTDINILTQFPFTEQTMNRCRDLRISERREARFYLHYVRLDLSRLWMMPI